MSLTFHPLYWVYHDCWKWEETVPGYYRNVITTFHHAGHIHYFFNKSDYNASAGGSGRAYGGTQTYHFRLNDIWGPTSDDPNQARGDRLVGKPIWYFHIEEYWRRIYVQPWEIENSTVKNALKPGFAGIKYDASRREHSLGPFREGGGLYFFNSKLNRTLPVEYWRDDKKRKRDYYLKRSKGDSGGSEKTWDFGDSDVAQWYRPAKGYYWVGDNSKPYKKGSVVYDDSSGMRKYYRYTYQPSSYEYLKQNDLYTKSERYWANPPVSFDSEIDLYRDYVYYYDLTGEFNTYCNENGFDVNGIDSYDSFIGTKYHHISRHNLYEHYTIEAYGSVWKEITDAKEIKDIIGDYPQRLKVFDGTSAFNDGDNPFYKNGEEVNPYEVYKEYYSHMEDMTIPRGAVADGDNVSERHPRERSFSDEDGARKNFNDEEFIGPLIEYQRVTHLEYERLPEGRIRDSGINVYTTSSEDFGDGFEMVVELPYKVSGEVQSPFSKTGESVSPIGTYHHGVVKEEDKIRYKVNRFKTPDYGKKTDVEDAIGDVKKYYNHKYLEFLAMKEAGVEGYDIDEAEWYRENFDGKPILRNEDEGSFYRSEYLDEPIWMPKVTQHFITEDKIDYEGYVDSKGNFIVGDSKVVEFNIPENIDDDSLDGLWVEQFLGGIVRAEVEVVLEDGYGNRRKERTSIVAANSLDTFTGYED